jgi:hypothetical protein
MEPRAAITPYWTFWIPIIVTFLISATSFIWNIIHSATIKKIENRYAKDQLVHKLQFEKEFEIYKQLWKILSDLTSQVMRLSPSTDLITTADGYNETIQARLREVRRTADLLIHHVETNEPFYSKAVYAHIKELIYHLKNEIIDVEHRDKNLMQYWLERDKNTKKISAIAKKISDAIRERIGSL